VAQIKESTEDALSSIRGSGNNHATRLLEDVTEKAAQFGQLATLEAQDCDMSTESLPID